jgi:NAD(P)H-hydrate epimerase
MYVLNSFQTKEIDKKTILKGIKEEVLIEQAAFALSDVIESTIPKKILFLAGNGNNGADSIASARILKNRGYNTTISIVGNNKNFSEGFILQKQIAENFNVQFENINDIKFSNYDTVVDGIIGIGLKGSLNDELKEIINKVNFSDANIISIDIPTGVNSDTGEIAETSIHADITVTFGYLKIGHVLEPSKNYCGAIKIATLSFDRSYEKNITRRVITSDFVKRILIDYKYIKHKYDRGFVLVFAGEKAYPGAAVLTATAAQKSGAGIVKLITCVDTSNIISYEPSVICEKTNSDFFDVNLIETYEKDFEKADVIVIGSGCSFNSHDFFVEVIKKYGKSKKIIVDAAAIKCIKNFKLENTLITPHSGEMEKSFENTENNLEKLEQIALEHNITIMYKSTTTIITDGKNTFFNVEGGKELSKGGSGDVLTGVAAAFVAQGKSITDAAIAASYIMYKTASDLKEEFTDYFVTPKLIIDNFYKTFLNLQNEK